MIRPLVCTLFSFACTVLPILALTGNGAAQDNEALRSSVRRLEARIDQITKRIEELAKARAAQPRGEVQAVDGAEAPATIAPEAPGARAEARREPTTPGPAGPTLRSTPQAAGISGLARPTTPGPGGPTRRISTPQAGVMDGEGPRAPTAPAPAGVVSRATGPQAISGVVQDARQVREEANRARELETTRQELARMRTQVEQSARERRSLEAQIKALQAAREQEVVARRQQQASQQPARAQAPDRTAVGVRAAEAGNGTSAGPIVIHNNGGSIVIHVHQDSAEQVAPVPPAPRSRAVPQPAPSTPVRRLND